MQRASTETLYKMNIFWLFLHCQKNEYTRIRAEEVARGPAKVTCSATITLDQEISNNEYPNEIINQMYEAYYRTLY